MNIHNTLTVAAVTLIASAATVAPSTYAQTGASVTGGARVDAEINLDAKAKLDRDVEVEASTSASAEVRAHSTTTVRDTDRDDDNNVRKEAPREKEPAKSSDDSRGNMSEEHRSVVATFVKSLLSIADREGGIGSEVRTVAQSQNDTASTTATAIVKVEERSSFRTFLFGSDYKNLGIIRSALATTSANIAHLKALLGRTESSSDSAELTLQVKALEAEQAKVSAYVAAHEDTFSLFGWFTKLMVK